MRYTFGSNGRTYVHVSEEEASLLAGFVFEKLNLVFWLFVLMSPFILVAGMVEGCVQKQEWETFNKVKSEYINLERERDHKIRILELEIEIAKAQKEKNKEKQLRVELENTKRYYGPLIKDTQDKASDLRRLL